MHDRRSPDDSHGLLPRKPPPRRRTLTLVAAVLILAGLGMAFPGLIAFAEAAARNLRIFWWLILLVALGIWLAFFMGKKRD